MLRIISRGVSGLATDSPCGVWGRGWPTCLLHDSPLFGSHFKMWVGMYFWYDGVFYKNKTFRWGKEYATCIHINPFLYQCVHSVLVFDINIISTAWDQLTTGIFVVRKSLLFSYQHIHAYSQRTTYNENMYITSNCLISGIYSIDQNIVHRHNLKYDTLFVFQTLLWKIT